MSPQDDSAAVGTPELSNVSRITGAGQPVASAAAAEPAAGPKSYGRRIGADAGGSAPTAKTRARHCLLVDDSRMIRKIGRRIVEQRGYQVSEAENGQEALDKCRLAVPDLIILDWDMPIMTGIEFLAALRAEGFGTRPKVVFCTTHSGAQDIHQAVTLGADEFCTKPFNEAGLIAKLESIGAA